MFDKEKLIYFAGIIDGEGCIGIELQSANGKSRKVDYYIPRLAVINTCYPLIEWIINVFGGKHHIRKKENGRKLIYVWNIFGKDLEDIIRAIEPYLIVKKEAAKLILEYRATICDEWNISNDTHKKRKELYLRMRCVNKVGD